MRTELLLKGIQRVFAGVVMTCGLGAAPAVADDATTQQSDVFDCEPHLTNCDAAPSGTAQLLREDGYVTANVVTTNLSGDAGYTMWWVVFNNPDECTNGCNEPDLFDEDVEAAVIWAAGTVSSSAGTANFVATLAEGPTSVDQPFPDDVFGDQLDDAEDAEIHLVLRYHDETGVEALTTFEVHCKACYDEQFAVFLAGDDDEEDDDEEDDDDD